MGNIFGRDSGQPTDDLLPTGRPDNSYWRQRRQEKTWQLREALLDGNAKVACRLLGIPLDSGTELDGPAPEAAAAQRTRCCGMMPSAVQSGEPSGSRAQALGAASDAEAVEPTVMSEVMPEDYVVRGTAAPQVAIP